jgi:hypothetical protein
MRPELIFVKAKISFTPPNFQKMCRDNPELSKVTAITLNFQKQPAITLEPVLTGLAGKFIFFIIILLIF